MGKSREKSLKFRYNPGMPKEYTHLMIARSVRRAARGELKTLLDSCERPFLLGSIIPDSLYYFEISPKCLIKGAGLAKLPALFHEPAGSFLPKLLRAVTESSPGSEGAGRERLAFLLGMVSHALADHLFHPLIWRLSAGARESASIRHVRLEDALDLVLAGALGVSLKGMDPAGLVGLREEESEPNLGLYAGFLAGESGRAKREIYGALRESLGIQCLALALFKSRVFGRAAGLFDRAGLFKRYAALFYTGAVKLPHPELFLTLFHHAVEVTTWAGRALLHPREGSREGLARVLGLLRPSGRAPAA